MSNIEQVVEEFVARLRNGEQPTVDDYVRRHPDCGADLRDALDAQMMLEDVTPDVPAMESLPFMQLGEYRVLREVGRGGMGIVYEAEQASLGRHVALKVLPRHVQLDEQALARFRLEAQVAARLHHTNIVPVYGVGEHDGVQFYAMQFLQGQALDDVIQELAAQRRTPSADDETILPGPPGRDEYHRNVARVGLQVADALAYAHGEGVLHRDIKPSNLFLDHHGTVWVTDFGLATAEGTGSLTDPGQLVGTPQYMAPERFKGLADARSDICSLGLAIYEFATLRPAHEDEDRVRLLAKAMDGTVVPPRRHDPRIPVDLETIVLKATAREPGDRYGTAAALADDLRHFLAGEPIRARRVSPWERLHKWARRRPAVASLAGLSIAALLALAIGAAVYGAKLEGALARQEAALRRARALALANASVAAIDEDPMTALLLAREAARTEWLPEVATRLHAAIQASRERHVLQPHEDGVRKVVASLEHIATITDSRQLRLWDWQGELLAVLAPNANDAVLQGTALYAACDDGLVRVYEDGRVRTLRGHEGPVLALAVQGDLVASASADHTARIWGDPPVVLRGHTDSIRSVEFSSDGTRLVTASRDGTARCWTQEGAAVATLSGHVGSVRTASFSPDGKKVVSCGADNTVRVWDLTGKQLLRIEVQGYEVSIDTARFAPDGSFLLVAPWLDEPLLYNLDGTVRAHLRGHIGRVTYAGFAPHGRTILTASSDNTARIWSLEGQQLAVLRGHEDEVRFGAFSPDGSRVVTASGDRTARVWDVLGREVARFTGHTGDDGVGGASWAAYGPEGDVVTTDSDGVIRVREGERPLLRIAGDGRAVRMATAHPDGLRWLSASMDGTARLWSRAGDPLLRLDHDEEVWSAVFSPDGTRILTASGELFGADDTAARIYDLTGHEIARLKGHDGWILYACFSPDGDLVATAGADSTVRLWSADGTPRAILRGHDGWVTRVEFSPDGRWLVSGAADKTARIWTREGKPVRVLRGHRHWVTSASFSPDGTRILTASFDRTARLWDVVGNELAVLRGHDHRVNSANFSPDGRRVVTASTDGTVQVWLLERADLIALATRRINRDFTPAERARYAALLAADR